MSERTRSAYNRWAARYDTEPNPHTLLEHAPVLDAVAPSRHDSILDAGCGTGRYCVAFAKAGSKVTGVDFSEKMLAVAREHLPAANFVQADIEHPLPFEDAAFDKVNCAQTLKHLPDLIGPMREFARVLRVRQANGPTRRQGSPSAVSGVRSCLSGPRACQCGSWLTAGR